MFIFSYRALPFAWHHDHWDALCTVVCLMCSKDVTLTLKYITQNTRGIPLHYILCPSDEGFFVFLTRASLVLIAPAPPSLSSLRCRLEFYAANNWRTGRDMARIPLKHPRLQYTLSIHYNNTLVQCTKSDWPADSSMQNVTSSTTGLPLPCLGVS